MCCVLQQAPYGPFTLHLKIRRIVVTYFLVCGVDHMNNFLQTKPIKAELSERTLSLNLVVQPHGVVSIRSCEVLGRGFRNRVSFQHLAPIQDIMVGILAQAMDKCLNKLPEGAHVLSLPEFLVELPGLVLSGVHVMVMDAKDGVRNAIFRFKEFMGSINNAFRGDLGFSEAGSSHYEKLAMNVLEDICMPILNLCRSFETMNFGQNNLATMELQNRAREFEFQTELLKRFIFNASMEQERQHLVAGPTVRSSLHIEP